MPIFQNNLKRFLNNKMNFVLIMLIPLIFISLSFSGSGTQKAKVGIIDRDRTQLTQAIKKAIRNQADIAPIAQKSLRTDLTNNRIDTVLVIPKNFTRSLISGKPIKTESYHVQESNVSSGIRTYISGYLQDLSVMAHAARGNSTQFYKSLQSYQQNHLGLSVSSPDRTGAMRERTVSALGFVIFGLFMIVSVSSRMIMEDKRLKLYTRFFTTPLSVRSYNIQNILSYLTLSAVTIILLLALLVFGFHAALGPSLVNIFLVLLLFSIVSISIGVLISSVARTAGQANALSLLVVTPVAMLGGCFWPIRITPVFMQKIADFMPTTWGMRALTTLVYGNGLKDVMMDLLILAGFAALFFLLGSWRRTDIAS
ncbi:ABC transporter permease [Sporolactobacillus vineae]|uniref:ABC transporter permease n=1 Tax=Sporolactobacillus vineae TaxID=444463 RepID=UPI000289763E|nr:ABC transporter permease [Sporolactobacillus vineae]